MVKISIAVISLVLATLAGRAAYRAWEARAQPSSIAAKKIDLSALPPATQPAEAVAIQEPKRELKKPVLVELTFKRGVGKKAKPYLGAYEVKNVLGNTVSAGDADGSNVSLILTPGEYEIRVPRAGVVQKLSLVSEEGGDKRRVDVVVRAAKR